MKLHTNINIPIKKVARKPIPRRGGGVFARGLEFGLARYTKFFFYVRRGNNMPSLTTS